MSFFELEYGTGSVLVCMALIVFLERGLGLPRSVPRHFFSAVSCLGIAYGCNQLAMYANNGKMPVFVNHPGVQVADATHALASASTHLAFLTDWISIGGWCYISVGDIFADLGGAFIGILTMSIVYAVGSRL
jgi:hypothetical protein